MTALVVPSATRRPVDAPGSSVKSLGPFDSPELSVKYFVEDQAGVKVQELIPVFHRWIREDVLEDELIIDVANYAHVPKGPGVMLICALGHYGLDMGRGRAGLRYRRRRVTRGGAQEQLADAFRRALLAASLLETDPALEGRYRFRTDEVELVIYDRLLAPSNAETWESVDPPLRSFITKLYEDDEVSLEFTSSDNEPFAVRVATHEAPPLDVLLSRL